ncbi:insulinase family protein [Reichenbachiella carrageenanivorans]|uniref:Insulinase family protein n=1 Tax=Reichenbachiella carrageenanivorans TaxID=2979869 RepID=A0ABY6D2L6_9BACT|nr:pitrilysin family protein [Reichenbachiella carrageenanivorans]UXX80396.1 insulinase family protein [Reichenbachiella carrageenanivorans]
MLDRTLAPPSGEIVFGGLPAVNQQTLHSNTSLFWLQAGDQPVVKIELVFQSGIWFESKKSTSWLAIKMLVEGTQNKTAKEITAGFEKLGAFLEIGAGFDDVSISVYGLRRNFDQVISLLNEIINEPVFPKREFEILKSNRKDQIILNDNKSNLLASKKLREAIYGSSFPYGQALAATDIEAVSLEEVKAYYQERLFYQPKIYMAGDIDDQLVSCLNSQLNIPKATPTTERPIEFQSDQHDIYVAKTGSMQSSIRIAWLVPNKRSEDYFNYQIANSLLGGYFGSRLMKNIREEKGYTYGIHAYPVHLKHSSFGMIAGDVVATHTQDTFTEIKSEIDKLLNEPIPTEEVEVLTNYLAGSFLASINTPFQLMDKFKKIEEADLDDAYYDRYFDALRTIDENQIKTAIEKHFNPAAAYTTIVGLNQ